MSPLRFVFYLDPELAAIAAVPLDGGVVLVRRSIDRGYGLWVVPGGFVDVGEPVEAAVVRETLEAARLMVRWSASSMSILTGTAPPWWWLTSPNIWEANWPPEMNPAGRVFAPAEIPWD